LPKKFNIDKRKTELSALIRSGQITREEALVEIGSSLYIYDQKTVDYAINKLEISTLEWNNIMSTPIKSHTDYKTLLPIIKAMKGPIRLATRMKILPYILYLKYAK
jgi:hypothetical protein